MERLCQILAREGICQTADEPLARHSTLRIGGRARLCVLPQTREELLTVLGEVASRGILHWVIGRGSNLVFPDEGLDGAVIFTEKMKQCRVDGTSLIAEAGASLSALAVTAREHALTGLEFVYGIPGSLGGAVYMNAGAYGGEMAQVVSEVEYYDAAAREVRIARSEALQFAYRHSVFTDDPSKTVLAATLALRKGDRDAIGAYMEELLAKRREKQPLEHPSAGSTFRRPEGHFAGQLIESCGLKGYRIGGAEVSQKHAGFIVNVGGATAADVRALVEHIQSRVLDAYGVKLECEIRFL